jgi:quercetin dioxygenase-like cupin family protein
MQTMRFGVGRILNCAAFVSLLALATSAVVGKSSGHSSPSSASSGQESAKKPKLWAAEELKWQEDASLPGVKTVLLWGDPKTGEHGMLRKFPSGFAPPRHTHPSAERLIVLSGTIVVRYAGSAEKKLGPGSYSEIPANVEHSAKCAEGSECVFALISPGPFAIKPVPAK